MFKQIPTTSLQALVPLTASSNSQRTQFNNRRTYLLYPGGGFCMNFLMVLLTELTALLLKGINMPVLFLAITTSFIYLVDTAFGKQSPF